MEDLRGPPHFRKSVKPRISANPIPHDEIVSWYHAPTLSLWVEKMDRKALFLTLLAFSGVLLASGAAAQEMATGDSHGGSLADRIDTFGRNIFQSFGLGDQDRRKQASAAQPMGPASPHVPAHRHPVHTQTTHVPQTNSAPHDSPNDSRAQVSSGRPTHTPSRFQQMRQGTSRSNRSESFSPTVDAAPAQVQRDPMHVETGSANRQAENGVPSTRSADTRVAVRPTQPQHHTETRTQTGQTVTNAQAASNSTTKPAGSGLLDQPLHRRLSSLSHSAFDGVPKQQPQRELPATSNGAGSAVQHTTEPRVQIRRESEQPAIASRRGGASYSGQISMPHAGFNVPERSPTPAARIARRQTPPTKPNDAPQTSQSNTSFRDRNASRSIPASSPSGVASMLDGSSEVADQTGSTGRVLIARQSPVLSVQTLGPERIAVGRESAYDVVVENSGEMAAEEVSVMIGLPDWADVLAAEATTGVTQSMRTHQDGNRLQWKVGRLGAHSQQTLTLRIVPRERRPIDLAVTWNYNPVVSQTVIEVEEPHLEISLQGPRELLFGKKDIYRLELENTGNGAAQNVMITLQPIGSGSTQPVEHRLGTIAAGEKSIIELEITARQAGELTVQVEAAGDNGVQAALSENILVRRGNLKMEIDGPAVQYVGTPANYTIHLANDGNAPAENLSIVANLPDGATHLSHNHDGQLSENKDSVTWSIDSVAPGEEVVLTLGCQLGKAGASQLLASCDADMDLEASATASTKVEAIADLVLNVEDPNGPVAIGDEAVYKLKVHNRGTKDAESVEVVVFFSHGIEPVGAEGATYKLAPGQVVFDPLPSVPAGEEVVIMVKARGEKPGNHIFRTEVYCKPLGTRLLTEETTRFYQGGTMSRRTDDGRKRMANRDSQTVPTPAAQPTR